MEVHAARPTRSRAELEQLARQHLWMSYQAADGTVAGEDAPIIVDSEGCWLVDIDGRRYLDGLAALEASALGHREPRLAAAAAAQYATVEFVDTFRYVTPSTVELSAKIAELAPGTLNRTHFSAGGSEAVEAALKIARQFHVLRGDPFRSKVVSRYGAYHGCTYGAMAVDGHFYATRNYLYEPLPALGRFARPPYAYRCTLCAGGPCSLACADEIDELIRRERPETVAAVLLDPGSSAIAVSVPPDGYLARVREICDHHGVLLIADEVITGFGRTGRMFCCDHWDVVPDLMTLSKGLASGYAPIGATVVTDRVATAFAERPAGTLWHGHTFGGHPVACAIAVETIRIIEEEGLVEAAATMGGYLQTGLRSLGDHPSVGEVRGLGLLCGVEIVLDRATRQLSDPPSALGVAVRRACRDEGLVLAALEPGSTLLITPPLVIGRAEVDELVARLDRALARVERDWPIA